MICKFYYCCINVSLAVFLKIKIRSHFHLLNTGRITHEQHESSSSIQPELDFSLFYSYAPLVPTPLESLIQCRLIKSGGARQGQRLAAKNNCSISITQRILQISLRSKLILKQCERCEVIYQLTNLKTAILNTANKFLGNFFTIQLKKSIDSFFVYFI